MDQATLSLDPATLPSDAVEVGKVIGAWGIKGWFKVQPYSAQPEALFSSKRWFVQIKSAGAGEVFTTYLLPITQAKDHSDGVVAFSAAMPERNQAQLLKGARVFVPRSSFPTAGSDEYYWVDLIGLDVFNRDGQAMGRVKELLSTGAQTVMVLSCVDETTGKDSERMIPFVSVFVDKVDLATKRIDVDWQLDY